MAAPDLLARLRSASIRTRIQATYELESEDFDDSRVLSAVRANLAVDDPDLLDVTIIRLLLRGRDVCSVEPVLCHLESTRDDLVFSSGVLSLYGLACHFPALGEKLLRRFELLPAERLNTENMALLTDTIAKLRTPTD
jgi:hypothetical protein